MSDDGSTLSLMLELGKGTNRRCGDCTLCCKLVPVQELDKPSNTRCVHQSRRGCAVYKRLSAVSPSCALWSCQWLSNPDAHELRRPDRSHYVIDVVPDYIGAAQSDGSVVTVPVMQVWVDPDYPDAHRDPVLRRFMEHNAAKHGLATLVRYGNNRALFVVPPAMNAGEWREIETSLAPTHSGWTNPMRRIHDISEAIRADARARGVLSPAQQFARRMHKGGAT